MPHVAGIELGGTKGIALISDGQNILARHSVPTTTPQDTLGALADQLRYWYAQRRFDALGIASFGPLRLDRTAPDFGHMLATPKPGWRGVDIAGVLAKDLPCPVAIDTDVNGAALAEWHWGAGRDCSSLCYLTLGTGVGGGFVINGQPLHGGLHPEIGHALIRRRAGDDFPGICPFHGDCIEGLVSGPALHARFGAAAEHVASTDPRWKDVAPDLAQLMAIILLTTSAQRILIGGGVGIGQSHLLPLIHERTLSLLNGYLPHVDATTIGAIIRQPALGADAGPMGAVALAMREVDRLL